MVNEAGLIQRRHFTSLESKARRTFYRCILQLTPEDLCYIIEGKIYEGVYVYDHGSQSVSMPGEVFDIPWPVLYLLARHSRKHIFVGRKLPSLEGVHTHLQQFSRKVRWRWLLRHESGGSELSRRIRDKKSLTPDPSNVVVSSLQAWVNQLVGFTSRTSSNLFARASAKARSGGHTCGWWNTSGLIKLGFSLLASSNWQVVPADKDSGFALVNKAALPDMLRAALKPSLYQPIDWHFDQDPLYNQYRRLSSRVAWYEGGSDEEERDNVRRALRSGFGERKSPISKIGLTLKTHKPPGSVVFRVLLDCSFSPFTPLARWINVKLDHHLGALTHIAKDTRTLLNQVDRLEIDCRVILAKADIKDYYMSGEHSELCTSVSSLFPEQRLASLVKDATDFLISNQYVRHKALGDVIYRACNGAGMGMTASGNLADSVFYSTMELPFTLDAETRRRYGLLFYCRCKDDIFMVFRHDFGKIKEFKSRWSSFNPMWTIDGWEFSTAGVDFLDVSIFLPKGFNKLQYLTHWKATSLGVCLSPLSSHLESVHISWMFSEIVRVAKTSSSYPLFKIGKQTFLDKLRNNNIPSKVIRSLAKFDPYIQTPSARGKRRDRIFVVLPFHPVLAPLAGMVKQFSQQLHIANLYSMSFGRPPPEVTISWKKSGNHLVQILKK